MKKTGRPNKSTNELDILFLQIEPYLKSGLSLHKSCVEAKVPYTSVKNFMQERPEFLQKVRAAQQHLGILMSVGSYSMMERIASKMQNGEPIGKEELDFFKWFAIHRRAVGDEFGVAADMNPAEEAEFDLITASEEASQSLRRIYAQRREIYSALETVPAD